jgi:hypothetical protein
MHKLPIALFVAAALGAGVSHAQTAAPAPAGPGPAARTTGTQGTGAAAVAAAQAPTTVKAVQPGLLEVAGPRVTEVAGAGIQKISAPAGKSVSVQSPWGASTFGWPKGVKPVAFTITIGKGGQTATIDAPGYTEANRADYKAAIDAVVPVAIAKTGDNKAAKEHTRR